MDEELDDINVIKPTDESALHKLKNGVDISKLMTAFTEYKEARQILDQKIIENENWYKQNYWQYIKDTSDGKEPQSGTLLNAIWSKHADFMDNEPKAVFMAREKNDEEQSKILSKVIPVVMENARWNKVYSDYCWYIIKQGVACMAATWDDSLENGLGDIVINQLDILRIYWEPNCTNIQDSRYVFVLSLIDTDILNEQYDFKTEAEQITSGQDAVMIESYEDSDENILDNKTVVIDCYERCVTEDGRQVVHLTKIAHERVLESSLEDEELSDTGIYEHGKYPFVIGQFLPLEGTLEGMGIIDIAKSNQSYIDKMDTLIQKNAIVSSKQRWVVKKDSGIKIADVMDLSKDVIESSTLVDETAIRALQAAALPDFVKAVRTDKIAELKELTGNRDFNNGGTTGGVTAFGAISALQEAGNKTARDLVRARYFEYKELMTIVVELVREFYKEERNFRITGEDNKSQYVQFSNKGMQNQITNKNEMIIPQMDGSFIPNPSWTPTFRKPVYDLDIIAQKENPFNTINHNQMMIDLFKLGAFNPDAAVPATLLLENMIFDGREKVLIKIKENGDMMQQMQQLQQQLQMQQQQFQQQLQQVQQQAQGKIQQQQAQLEQHNALFEKANQARQAESLKALENQQSNSLQGNA